MTPGAARGTIGVEDRSSRGDGPPPKEAEIVTVRELERGPRRRPGRRSASVWWIAVLVLIAGCDVGTTRRSPADVTVTTRVKAPGPSRVAPSVDAVRRSEEARRRRRHDAVVFAREALASRGPCFGAAAMAMPGGLCAATAHDPVTPALSSAPIDKSDAYSSVSGAPTCFSYRPWFPEVTCVRGDRSASTRIALVGNSHAGQWLPTLEVLAKRHRWRIVTYLASNCALSATPQAFEPSWVSAACLNWVRTTVARVASGHFGLVVVSDKLSMTAVGRSLNGSRRPYEQGYLDVLRAWKRVHLRVLGIRDTPTPWPEDVPRCLLAHQRDHAACDGRRSAWLTPDPMPDAVRVLHDPHIMAADLTSDFCTATTCPAVVGRVVVYFDGSHITATYARTLAPNLEPFVRRAMSGPGR